MIETWWPTPIYYEFIKNPIRDQIQLEFDRVFQQLKQRNLFETVQGWNPKSPKLSDSTFLKSIVDDYQLTAFKDELLSHVIKFVAYYGVTNVTPNDFRIKQSWMTLTNQGESSHTHSHGSTDISGVYYFKTNENDGSIYFESSNKLMNASAMFSSSTHTISYKPEVGKLILFPGFLEHGVYENTTDHERVSVSFNIFVNRF